MEWIKLARPISGLALLLALVTAARPVAGQDIIYRNVTFYGFPNPWPATGIGPSGAPGKWIAGDAGYLCPINSSTMLLTSCDIGITRTSVADNMSRYPDYPNAVHDTGNSVSIMTVNGNSLNLQHYYRGYPPTAQYQGNARAFFPFPGFEGSDIYGRPLPDPNCPNLPLKDQYQRRVWPRKAFCYNENLYIFGHLVRGSGPVLETYLIKVTNPTDPPPSWQFIYYCVGTNNTQGTAFDETVHDNYARRVYGDEVSLPKPGDPGQGYVYILGHLLPVNADGQPNTNYDVFSSYKKIPLRINLDRLESAQSFHDLQDAAEWLRNDFSWQPGLNDPDLTWDAQIPAFSSASLRHNATLGMWQCVYIDDSETAKWIKNPDQGPAPVAARAVYAMSATTPFGNPPSPGIPRWSTPQYVCTIPQLDPQYSNTQNPNNPNYMIYNPNNAAYFIREIPSFEQSDREIQLTYTVVPKEGLDNDRFRTDFSLYNILQMSAPNPLFSQSQTGGTVPMKMLRHR